MRSHPDTGSVQGPLAAAAALVLLAAAFLRTLRARGGVGPGGAHGGCGGVAAPGAPPPAAAASPTAPAPPASTEAALLAYNHSDGYVTDVLGWAARYGAGGAQALAAETSPACEQAAPGPQPAGTAGKVIAYAEAQLGKPYQWGATGPHVFDCSGLTMMAYRTAAITIPLT